MSSPTETAPGAFDPIQREYLAGLFAGIAQRGIHPYVGTMEGTGLLTSDPAVGGPNRAAPAQEEEKVHGTPVSELNRQELWKHELAGLDSWDRLVQHAQEDRFPGDADNFRFRYHGLFHVAPAQDSFMMRARIPAGELTSAQMRGMADLAEELGDGKAAVTTRSNLQVRGIAPRHLVEVVTRLVRLGLTAKGSGADNIRNITASPTAGFDPQELLDTRPFAHALHHYILNSRDLFDLPRKFNVAFEGGGAVDTVADTNDIGFMACRVPATASGLSLRDGAAAPVEPGAYFRVELCGITGHRQFASDTGLLVRPSEAVAVAAAMIRVFSANGDRTDRKKARLKYLVDRWGVDRFLSETQARLAFPLVRLPMDSCIPRPPSIKHGHIGVYRQRQPGRNYVGVVVPVGILTARQMRRLADIAEAHGSGTLRLTPWQNLIIPDVTDAFVESVRRQLVRAGLHHEADHVLGGLVACTGSRGCKYAGTDTKGHAVELGGFLQRRLRLDQPLNIHFTGCPNSCAQHYIGDIGLQGVRTQVAGESVEAYHIVFGGGVGHDQSVARQVFTNIPWTQVPDLLERALRAYLRVREPGESFAAFTRRHDVKRLQELFSE
jgi:ferredoxin-nitrite reductase